MCFKIRNSITKWIRHNQAMTVSIVLIVLMTLWFTGCQSRTQSLMEHDLMVTQSELEVEYTWELRRLENELLTLKETTELRLQDLHRQDVIKQALFNNAMLIAESGNPNPLGLLSLLGTIFGIGAVIDNRRKDGLIKGFTDKNK